MTAPDKVEPEIVQTSFVADQKWLRLPVRNNATKRTVELWVGGGKQRWFDIELAEDAADWFAYVDIEPWRGRTMELRVPPWTASSRPFTDIQQSDDVQSFGPAYRETLRPQFHFSAKRGWLNDPNGLVYYEGEYHLFFQHNPYGTTWGNMHWGHAVSSDLVHWKELGIALYPERAGTMFSGSAVVDWNNTSGLGQPGKPPLVLIYTTAGDDVQGLAASNDGRTFTKLAEPIVPKLVQGNRDPKVIWHAPTSKWVMVLYAGTQPGEQRVIQFLISGNLKTWTPVSVIEGGPAGDGYFFECPDFFELPVDGVHPKCCGC